MLPWKFLEILGGVIAILYVLFEQYLRKILFKFFLPLILSPSPNMMHFVSTFRFMLPRCKDYCYRRGSKLWKNCIDQKHC